MEQPDKIIDLNEVLIKDSNNKTVTNYTSSYLTAPGENYGSIMLALEIQLESNNTTKTKEIVHAVAKLVPKNEFIRAIFQPQITFKKELGMYATVIPLLRSFQKTYGIEDVLDIFPKFCGGRLGLEGTGELGTNPVILLENLKVSGFEMVDRTVGFDLPTSKLILRELGRFHSVGIAIKLKQQKVFQEQIMQYISHFDPLKTMDPKIMEDSRKELYGILEEDEECVKYVDRFKTALEKSLEFYQNPIITRETFTGITHSDFWINNIMVKFIDGKPVKIKLVDFQLSDYGSIAKDILLFIYCNVQTEIFVNYYDDLIEEYHKSFVYGLKQLQIDTTEFSMNALMKELGDCIKEHSLFHCTIMLQPIFAEKDKSRSVEEISQETFTQERSIPKMQKERTILIVKDFVKRNWI